MKKLFVIGVYVVAAIFVMIVHEFIKSICYFIYVKKYEPTHTTRGICKFWHYIDPIGLLLAFTRTGIFSKQYAFLIKSRKATIAIGIAGYVSMITLFISSCFLHKTLYPGNSLESILKMQGLTGYYHIILPCFLQYCAYFSAAMFVTNLFPLTSFDISLIIAGKSQRFFLILKNYDELFKVVFILLLLTGLYSDLATLITTLIL